MNNIHDLSQHKMHMENSILRKQTQELKKKNFKGRKR
uniref:Uncharacterized protein n=1 Tax=Rhizophora mucronata TaxID=61149 RepID=A0A2P2QKV3_RHIMU